MGLEMIRTSSVIELGRYAYARPVLGWERKVGLPHRCGWAGGGRGSDGRGVSDVHEDGEDVKEVVVVAVFVVVVVGAVDVEGHLRAT